MSKHRITIDLAGEDGQQLHDLLTYYRILRQESWTEMVLKSIAMLAGTENQLIADTVTAYLEHSHFNKTPGRPVGVPQPKHVKEQHSKRMKEYWANKKARLETIEL